MHTSDPVPRGKWTQSDRIGGHVMEQALFALPILPRKTEAARAFLHEMDGPRKQELAACSQGAGLAREVWAIQQTPQGDLVIVTLEGDGGLLMVGTPGAVRSRS